MTPLRSEGPHSAGRSCRLDVRAWQEGIKGRIKTGQAMLRLAEHQVQESIIGDGAAHKRLLDGPV